MKLLLDENISRRILPELSRFFPDSSQVVLLGLEAKNDIEVWRFAKAQEYVIVTKDEDFLDFLSVYGFPPKIILLGMGNCLNQKILDVLISSQEKIESMLKNSDIGLIELY